MCLLSQSTLTHHPPDILNTLRTVGHCGGSEVKQLFIAHFLALTAKSCFAPADILSVSPVFTWTAYLLWPFAACLLTLPAFRYPLCLPPAPTFALPLLLILPCLHYSCYYLWPLPVWPPLVCIKAAIGSNLTASSLQKTSPPQIQRLCFGYPAQPNHGLHRPTPTASPGRPVYWGVCSPVLWADVSGTALWRNSVQRLIPFRAQ